MRMRRAGPPPMRRQKPKPRLAEKRLEIDEEYITLGQLLKMAGIVGTGGEAKYYLAETLVHVNGEPEQRRGRKLRSGDVVIFPGEVPFRLASKTPTSLSVEED